MTRTSKFISRRRGPADDGADRGNLDPSQEIEIVFLLRAPPGAPPLREIANRVVAERRPWSIKQYAEVFGAAQEDLAAVRKFAAKREWRIVVEDRTARTVGLRATVGSAGQAFGVNLQSLRSNDETLTYRTFEGEAEIPPELLGIVERVLRLDTTPLGAPRPPPRTAADGGSGHRPNEARVDPSIAVQGPTPWSWYLPPEFGKFYDFPMELHGDGVTVGVLELSGGFQPSDMAVFFGHLGIPVPDIRVTGKNDWNPGNFWGNAETTLDLQIIGSIVPSARLVAYLANADNVSVDLWDVLRLLDMAIFDAVNKPSILSWSWGGPENLVPYWTREEAEIVDERMIVAAILGITMCVASGDSGSIFPVGGNMFGAPSLAWYPASSPWALACGGTTLQIENGRVAGEVVWNGFADMCVGATSNLGSTGGGVSLFFPKPDWQRLAPVPKHVTYDFAELVFAGHTDFEGRGVPDIAANADLLVAYRTYIMGKWRHGGATSAVAPLIAALLTQVHQAVGHRLGFLNALLYDLQLARKQEVFRSITEGNNAGYAAGREALWNPCAGLGSPRGRALLEALRKHF